MKKHAAPLIAAILLLLPVLYVGSFYLLIKPQGFWMFPDPLPTGEQPRAYYGYYRIGERWASQIFWPLEKIDRRLRTYQPRPVPSEERKGTFISVELD
jgi:hypothetical protein